MGSEVNPVCLSQVSLFVLILEGSGQLVLNELMLLPGRRPLKQVRYSAAGSTPLCVACLTLSLTHTGTKRNHLQLSVRVPVYLDNSGILSNYKL